MSSPRRYDAQELIKKACEHARQMHSEDAKLFFAEHSPNITDGRHSPLQQLLAENVDDKAAKEFIKMYGAALPLFTSFTTPDFKQRDISPNTISLHALSQIQYSPIYKKEFNLAERKIFIQYRKNISHLINLVYEKYDGTREESLEFQVAILGAAIAGNQDVLDVMTRAYSYFPIYCAAFGLSLGGHAELAIKAYEMIKGRPQNHIGFGLDFSNDALYYLHYGALVGYHYSLFHTLQEKSISDRAWSETVRDKMIANYKTFLSENFSVDAQIFNFSITKFDELKPIEDNKLQIYLDESLVNKMTKLLLWFQKNADFFPIGLNRIILEYLIGLPYQMVKDTHIKKHTPQPKLSSLTLFNQVMKFADSLVSKIPNDSQLKLKK